VFAVRVAPRTPSVPLSARPDDALAADLDSVDPPPLSRASRDDPLCDPALLDESRRALDELTRILSAAGLSVPA
jgi:succinylarginine dihydrolase